MTGMNRYAVRRISKGFQVMGTDGDIVSGSMVFTWLEGLSYD